MLLNRTRATAWHSTAAMLLLSALGAGAHADSKADDAILDELKDERFADAVYSHEPIYLLVGGSPSTDIKYQLSFKVLLCGPCRLFLSYTQLNHWDISRDSSPFRDTTHRPSLFWYGPGPRAPGPDETGLETIDFHASAGYEHNSNGRAGPESRSLDLLFVRGTGFYGHPDQTHGRVSIKLFTYINKSSQNADIQDYRRWFDLQYSFLRRNTFDATYTYAHGKSGKGSHQLELSYALKELGLSSATGFLMFQVFNGYGETLQDYNVKGPTQFRLGYMIERARGKSDRRFASNKTH